MRRWLPVLAVLSAVLAFAAPARADLCAYVEHGNLPHNCLDSTTQTTDLVTDLRTFVGVSSATTNGTGNTASMVYARGGSAVNDGGSGFFYWNPTSTAADDGSNTIQPTAITGSNPGRWVRVEPAAQQQWSSYTPTVACTSGTLSAYTTSAEFVINGKTVFIKIHLNITNVGSCSGDVTFTLPGTNVNDEFALAATDINCFCGAFANATDANEIILTPGVSGILAHTYLISGLYQQL